jgi:COP9 signalosome complex subunit 6
MMKLKADVLEAILSQHQLLMIDCLFANCSALSIFSSAGTSTTYPKKMATLGSTKEIIAQKEASSGIALSLHPVVIMHISDHWTRIRATSGNPNPRVIGGLLGKQSGRNVEILFGYELLFKEENASVEIDVKYLNEKTENSKRKKERM